MLQEESEGRRVWSMGELKSKGLVTKDLVVHSKAAGTHRGILGGGRHDMTYILENTLVADHRKDGRVHKGEVGTRRPSRSSFAREVLVA